MKKPENNTYKPIFQSFFKPITETQKATMREIMEELKPIKEGIETVTFPAYQSIQAVEETVVAPYFIGDIAESYLKRFATKGETDTTYGLYVKGNKSYIGNKPVDLKDNNIIVGDEEYEGTPVLWELIMTKEPKD